jgi:hypothetical protein
MIPVVIVLSWGGRKKGRDGGGNLPMFHIRLSRIVTLNSPCKINVCHKSEKKNRSSLKTSGRDKEFSWSCLMVSWVGDVQFKGNF